MMKKEQYKEMLKSYMNEHDTVSTKSKRSKQRTIALREIETWVQLADKLVEVDVSLFVNNKGDLIKVKSEEDVVLIYRDEKIQDRYYYKIAITDANNNVKLKSISIQALIHICFSNNINIYGADAKDRYNKKGIDAFGSNKEDLQAHHKDYNKLNNNANNILFLNASTHTDIHRIQANTQDSKQVAKKLVKVANREEPEQFTILDTGIRLKDNKLIQTNKRDIQADTSIVLTEQALQELTSITNTLNTINIMHIINNLFSKLDIADNIKYATDNFNLEDVKAEYTDILYLILSTSKTREEAKDRIDKLDVFEDTMFEIDDILNDMCTIQA